MPLPTKEELAETVAKVQAFALSRRGTFAAEVAHIKSILPPLSGIPTVMAGPIHKNAGRDITYSTSEYLYESEFFLPYMMMHLPYETRWKYVKRFEEALATLVLTRLGGSILGLTEGNVPGYDIMIETDEGVQKVEIKSTEKHRIFIEGGRYDMTASGLSLTESDVYLILSRDMKINPDGTFDYIGKVRICFTYLLVREYQRIAEHSEMAFRPDAFGPGSRGVKMDPKKDLPHIWIGDVACEVDQFGNTVYDLSKFIREPAIALQARKEYNQGVRLMEKFDVRPEEIE